MSDQAPEFEEVEQIPWSALAAKTPIPWERAAYLVAGVVAVVVLGVVGGRLLWSGDGATVVTLPPIEAPGPTTAPTTTTSSSGQEAMPVVTEPPPAATVYSEADLMAISIDDDSRLATMRAEWFVQDYFTVDGDARVATDLAEAIGERVVPHQDPSGYSYVEWARAFGVASPLPGRYVVDVAYRTLVPAAAEGFARTAVRAVAITVDVDVDGSTQLVDLPTPVTLPGTVPMATHAGVPGTAPDETVAEALRLAGATGMDPTLVGVTRDGTVWRFLMELADPSGNQWPMVIMTNGE